MRKLFILLFILISYTCEGQILQFLDTKKQSSYNDIDQTTGSILGTYTENTFTYNSSIDDSITGLQGKYCYDSGVSHLPLLIVMHSFWGAISEIEQLDMQRFASYKFFVAALNMRSRSPFVESGCDPAKEIYDIYDGIQHIKANYSSVVDTNKVILIGFSFGGQNVEAFCSKFPGYLTVACPYFGPSDLGNSATDSWYAYNNYDSYLDMRLGGNPSTVPYKYYACDNVWQLETNLAGTKMYIFHDANDPYVNVNLSRRISNLGLTNIVYNETNSSSTSRWVHEVPHTSSNSQVIQAENYWKNEALIRQRRPLPNSGTFRIGGYLKAYGLFEIRLGNLNDHVATVSYNINTKTFVVTPIYGSQIVTIYFNGTSQNQTISSETTFNF